jgi:hypothetical protein
MTINAPATLLHIPVKVPEPTAMSALVGQYLYNDSTRTGVVPGTLAELYFNFGILGVFGGFFLIGRIARYCISLTHSAKDAGAMLLAFYALALLCISTIPMTATIILYLAATGGLPILVLVACEQVLIHSVRAPQESAARVTLTA